MHCHWRRTFLHLSAFWALAPHLSAQVISSTAAAGQIIDPQGAAIVDANIKVRQLNGPFAARQVSNQDGRFSIEPIPAGRYEFQIEHSGFRDLRRQVEIPAEGNLSLSFPLALLPVTENVTVSTPLSSIVETPLSQTRASVSQQDFRNSPAITIADVLGLAPGVTFVQGNGPRDVSISIRGSSTRQTYGVRNVQVFEDGFPVTQPDGLARTDLTDPHAYNVVDVIQGPSSAFYGNYATGGAIDFHTRSGSEIHGFELGADFGSFGYYNDYLAYGVGSDRYQISAFISNVRADQATINTQFNTITANILANFVTTTHDRMTFKFIENDLDTNLSIRLSQTQYQINPYQIGCEIYRPSFAANGCASVSVYINGYNGDRRSLGASEAGLNRRDRRTIVGARYEHDLTSNTTWQSQFVWDNRDANQPTSSSAYRGTLPSFSLGSDVVGRGSLANRQTTLYAGGFFNYENISSQSANLMPGGNAELGGATQTVTGTHLNTGFRGRVEFALAERWTLVAGLGGEYTRLNALANNFAYLVGGAPVISPVLANRTFFNLAPEVGVQFHPSHTWSFHTRLGTGYGTPQATQLFTNAQGQFGNNITLKTQRNIGIDAGTDWSMGSILHLSGALFYEWFRDEQVTQSAGVNLQSYTFNAPASAHRGVQASIDLSPLPRAVEGLKIRASYLYDNQVYTRYIEQLTTGNVSRSFPRNHRRIPGVQPHYLNARIIYDWPAGKLQGVGVYLETNWRDRYPLDNANFLYASGYTLVNLSTHYDMPPGQGLLSRLRFIFDIQNLADKTYIASASNITNTLNSMGQQNGASVLATSTGSIYAGTPRASYGGVRLRF